MQMYCVFFIIKYNFIMRKIIFTLLFTLIVANTIYSDEKILIRVGVYNNPPKIYMDQNGIPAGYHIDIIKEIAALEGWTLEFNNGTWDELLNSLKTGDLDILPDVAYSEERAAQYRFNNETVLLNWAVIY